MQGGGNSPGPAWRKKNSIEILLLSPYHAASHAYWADQLISGIREIRGVAVTWNLRSLPPRHFAFRLKAAPLSLWDYFSESGLCVPDLLIATSSTDLTSLRSWFPAMRAVPCLLYFHENQFVYPPGAYRSREQQRDFCLTQLYSALAADCIAFNSRWNRESFLEGVNGLLNALPEAMSPGISKILEEKSRVIYLPVADPRLVPGENEAGSATRHGDRRDSGTAVLQIRPPTQLTARTNSVPHFIWPHRWEYDKGPGTLQEFCRTMDEQGHDFRLSLLGRKFRTVPGEISEILEAYARQIVRAVPFADTAEYYGFLRHWGETDNSWVISTADHEFFGISVVEAVLAGCTPLVPDGLSYRELIAERWRYEYRRGQSEKSRAQAMYNHWKNLEITQRSKSDPLSDLLMDPRPSARLEDYRLIIADLLDRDCNHHPEH